MLKIPQDPVCCLVDHLVNKSRLEESTTRWHLKSNRSLSGRSFHLILVTKRSRSWSWMTNSYPFYSMPMPFLSYFKNLTMKIHGQGHACGQSSRSHFWLSNQSIYFLLITHKSAPSLLIYSYLKIWLWRPKVKVMTKVKTNGHIWGLEFNPCFLFVSWQSDHFWLRYSRFHIRLWKYKVKVMAKVRYDGHIWSLEFIQYVCFLFCGNRTILGWDTVNSIFDLENSRSRSQWKSTRI